MINVCREKIKRETLLILGGFFSLFFISFNYFVMNSHTPDACGCLSVLSGNMFYTCKVNNNSMKTQGRLHTLIPEEAITQHVHVYQYKRARTHLRENRESKRTTFRQKHLLINLLLSIQMKSHTP